MKHLDTNKNCKLYYHTHKDTPDKINQDRFAYMFDMLKMTVAKLADVKFT